MLQGYGQQPSCVCNPPYIPEKTWPLEDKIGNFVSESSRPICGNGPKSYCKALNLVRKLPKSAKYLSERWENDLNMVIHVVEEDPNFLQYVEKKFANLKRVVDAAVEKDGLSLKYAKRDYLSYKSQLIGPVLTGSASFSHEFKRSFQDLVDTCFKAVKNNGLALEHVPKPLLPYAPKIVKEAVKQNGLAIQFIFDLLEGTNSFVTIRYSPKLIKAIVLTAIRQDVYSYMMLPKHLQNNVNVVREVVKKDGLFLRRVDKRYLDDVDIVDLARKQNPEALESATERVRKILLKRDEESQPITRRICNYFYSMMGLE